MSTVHGTSTYEARNGGVIGTLTTKPSERRSYDRSRFSCRQSPTLTTGQAMYYPDGSYAGINEMFELQTMA